MLKWHKKSIFISEYLTRKTSQKTPVYGFVYGFLILIDSQ